MIDDNSVWLITGSSSGLGRALTEKVLEHGYRAVVTARRPAAVRDLVEHYGDRAMAVGLDVTQSAQVSAAVKAAHERFGRIDVLVNNAGYGYIGAIEEGEDAEIRAQFDTNVHGVIALMQAVLPGMRHRGKGHIVNVSSIGGLTTFPNVGYYHASKYALEGLSDTLAKEMAPFGIGVTVVEPGAFRTDFRGRSMRQSRIRIPEFAGTLGKQRDALLDSHGKQHNDPAKGALAIIEALKAKQPPLHLLLGADALDLAHKQLAALRKDFDAWETLSRSTAFDEAG
ncbi:3-phenylpropionate-dihydrodiol/cinnamic acid-dihydrodiol dehydrogenase [Paraburkholderia aspalathi]|uniref:3-phenylpropionate-dihydrodiol/cinnamic acid-dihydrodiol dehydrogenase n=1 Tax=Paraburkholderia aspalathi TaxID=1324617 RepID=A0ABM8R7A0_9BURK|nr:oxidoreductase [Paraburkholderia aspalathi]MBK3818819.1 SDR family NAD(P)-dependent oxidoreductase [Paraburkholderia aspalathi]MBK3830710.1 SDR family NAD(P)-dependent oxidoreductase [Paraburkholderia aspalathi]MBK3860412.1 SDR family NAD(P)-dependent oxidoreductase [Paraburkholderia aspalathi]CAE6736505.1 3-phenylpropionate-dihydrodiol/cinnamic acid-dihydrodiol dehydrogenase [Paraburkholderia aspalathi]